METDPKIVYSVLLANFFTAIAILCIYGLFIAKDRPPLWFTLILIVVVIAWANREWIIATARVLAGK
jgi:hypothetical protein